MDSAKLAKSTVNHSQSVIWMLNLNAAAPLKSRAVVMTLPISTTNITGLPIMVRGLSFTNASTKARRTIFHSQIAFDFFAIESLESLARSQEQVLQDRSQAQGREEIERSQNQNRANHQHGEDRRGHGESSQRRRNIVLARQVASNG